jgi:hypothetical protein
MKPDQARIQTRPPPVRLAPFTGSEGELRLPKYPNVSRIQRSPPVLGTEESPSSETLKSRSPPGMKRFLVSKRLVCKNLCITLNFSRTMATKNKTAKTSTKTSSKASVKSTARKTGSSSKGKKGATRKPRTLMQKAKNVLGEAVKGAVAGAVSGAAEAAWEATGVKSKKSASKAGSAQANAAQTNTAAKSSARKGAARNGGSQGKAKSKSVRKKK